MFHNISNPKWFGNWSRLEDDYLGNGGTDIADQLHFLENGKNRRAFRFHHQTGYRISRLRPGDRTMPPALGRWPASPSTSTRCRFPISRT